MVSALRSLSRARGTLATLRERLPDPFLRRHLLGDPDVVADHAEVAAALTGVATVAGVLGGVTGLVVSPVVWDGVLLASAVLLGVLVVANAYWRGGVVLGYGLALGPVLGGAAGGATVGTFGAGFVHANGLFGMLVGVPVFHAVGVALGAARRRYR